MHLDSGAYFALDEVGGFIWRRLDGRRDLRSIAEEVARDFEVSAAEAQGDLLEFVASLAELGLVERAAGA